MHAHNEVLTVRPIPCWYNDSSGREFEKDEKAGEVRLHLGQVEKLSVWRLYSAPAMGRRVPSYTRSWFDFGHCGSVSRRQWCDIVRFVA
jgi:hypothetical protein